MFASFARRALAPGLFCSLAVGLTGLGGCASDNGNGSVSDRGGNGPARIASDRDGAGGNGQYTLAYPTGDRATSTLLLQANGPGQARVGQPYNYTLRVTNLTDTPLHDVEIRNLGAMPERATPGTANAGVTPDQARLAADQSGTTAAPNRPTEARRTEMHHDGDRPLWAIGTLGPKETQTRQFSEVADEVGTIRNCLSVTYHPTLCVAVQVVQPELAITKTAPSSVLICQAIPVTYHVTNTGTGVASAVRLEDRLPEGLQTAQGQNVVTADVGDLRTGESKDVTVQLKATRTGEFGSRAAAQSGQITAQSRQVATIVHQPTLAVAVEGPEAAYTGQGINYRVTVRNTGDVPAENTVLHLDLTNGDKLADRNIGTIPAGEARSIAITAGAARAAGEQVLTARAEAQCAPPASERAAVAIRTVPALRLECVDSVDPVGVQGNTVYTIQVTNQGTGPDANIRVVATLPAEQQFVQAGGATQGTANGQTVTFAPVATLGPKQSANWTVEVKAIKAGDVRFEVQMQSDSMTQPAFETEPTKQIANAARDPVPVAPGNGPANPAAPVPAPGNTPASQPGPAPAPQSTGR